MEDVHTAMGQLGVYDLQGLLVGLAILNNEVIGSDVCVTNAVYCIPFFWYFVYFLETYWMLIMIQLGNHDPRANTVLITWLRVPGAPRFRTSQKPQQVQLGASEVLLLGSETQRIREVCAGDGFGVDSYLDIDFFGGETVIPLTA